MSDDAWRKTRDKYKHFLAIPTRWMDNDIYAHVNNVVYYSYFDTVINAYLVREGGLDIVNGPVIGLAIENSCRFYHELTFPETVQAGLCVGHIGNSSVRYEIGLFGETYDEAAAAGHFVHVFVDRQSRRPTRVPDPIRSALQRLKIDG
ncbi:MAG: acyl-CoA thioesterase [Alphaproteobacteria bacterium]|nr:acyl-CoA thioesterase [Alphaproteobacteria bacterium]